MSTAAGPATGGKLARTVVIITATAAMLGIIYGYDGGVIGGAQIYLQSDWGLSNATIQTVVASLVWGELVGAILGGIFINKIGRKGSMILLAAGYVLFSLASALSVNVEMLVTSRVLLGFCIGISLIAVPVYVAESIPAAVRGKSLVLYQVMCVVGIILGLGFSLVLAASAGSPGPDDTGPAVEAATRAAYAHFHPFWVSGEDSSWRIMLGLAALPALILLPIIFRLPESARWYSMKNRWDDARASMLRTDPTVDPTEELANLKRLNDEETGGALREMLRKPYRRATMFVLVLGFFIQITGINATVTYGPQIFKSMGIQSDTQNIMMSMLVQVFALIAVLFSMRYVDRWGRRPVLLSGISIMIVAQIIMVITFASQEGDTLVGWQITAGFIGLALINIGFVFGFGSLVWVYSSESFPSRLRAYGSSMMLGADLFANLLIAQFFLTVMATIGGAGSFGLFAALAVVAWVFVFKVAPETKGRDLDDIQAYWVNGGKWPEQVSASDQDNPAG